MMNDAPSSESVQARAVFLFENERYSPISGWSAKGLLPTDRNAFTTSDTMHGYHSIPEATTAFVCAGWDWLPQHDWTVDMNLDNIDLEGWTYSVDFGSLKDETCGSRTKGAMHFVRRRRWVRFQYFDARLIAPGAVLTCSYCDLEEVERLSALLLEKLSEASALKHPSKNSDINTIALKNRMMATLDVKNPGPDGYSFHAIESRLATFVSQSRSTLSAASSLMAADSPDEILRKRTAWMAQTHFTPDEGNEIARLIIRVQDRNNVYHCDKAQCGAECDFFLEMCGNEGCGMVYSRKWANKHSGVCLHKVLPCERECGENVKRMMMKEHLEQHCGLRIVRCPCYEFGCKAEIFARELKEHAQENQIEHLAMIVGRVKEVQHVVAGHQHHLATLDSTTQQQAAALATVTASIAAAVATTTALEARADRNLRDSVKALEGKIAKESSANSANRSDINAIRAQIAAAAKK